MNSSKWTWLFSLALVAAFVAPSFGQDAPAKKDWNKEHPRRHEVNKRLKNQNKRAKEGVADGKLTKDQAAQVHKEDHAIRKEERRDAAKNGGHITKAEQKKINRQENHVNHQIKKDEAGNAAPAPAAPAPAAQ